MLRFGETKVTKEKFHTAKKPIKTGDVNVDNIVNSKANKTKTNSKNLIGYSDKAIRPLVLIMSKWVNVLRHLKLKMEIKIKRINSCLPI